MISDTSFQLTLDWQTAAPTTIYMQLPYRCKMKDVAAICQTSIDVDETITVTYGTTVAAATAIGVLTMPTGAGAVGAWVLDTTTGDTVLAADGYLKFVTSASAGNASQCDLNVTLDIYAAG